MKITAAVARSAELPFTLESATLDPPRTDEILIRVVGVGLCHTDLVFKGAGGDFPAILGHEGSGIVEEVGASVTKVNIGDRVAISFRSCGECPRCLGGDPAYCLSMPQLNLVGSRPDGSATVNVDGSPAFSHFFGQSSFATHCLAYERNVVRIPDDIPLELVGPLGCGIQTGAGSIMRSLQCERASSLLIIGGGTVGLSAVMAAKLRECGTVILVEPHSERRELAMSLGATHTIDPGEYRDLAVAVRQILPTGVDYALDTSGIPDMLEMAVLCLAPKGALGLVGISPPGTRAPGDLRAIITYGLTVKGIIEGDSDLDGFITELIELYRGGLFPFDRLITTYPLAQINQAIEDQHSGKCVKVVLLPGGLTVGA